MIRKKVMMHERCGGEVSKKTLICKRCHKKPSGKNITLVRLRPKRPADDFDDIKFKMSLGLRGFKYFRT